MTAEPSYRVQEEISEKLFLLITITVLVHFRNVIKQTLTSAGSDILTAANSVLLMMYFLPGRLYQLY